MSGSSKKKKVRELMAEMGTNYTTALRAYDAAITERYATADAAAASFAAAGHLSPSGPDQQQESASPAASDRSLSLQFSHSSGTDVEADRQI